MVFSTTLTEVQGNARLATGSIAEEIAALRDAPGHGDISVGGAELAAQTARLGLIDEYRIRVYPVLVGGGTPFYAQGVDFTRLDLVESRVLAGAVQYLRYRVQH